MPEPHVLLFRRPLSSREEPPSETSLRADANADIECKIQEEDQQQLSAVDEERRQARSRTGDTFEAKDDTDDECDDENQEEQNDSGDQHDNDGRGGGESKSTSKLTRRHVINAKVSPPLKETGQGTEANAAAAGAAGAADQGETHALPRYRRGTITTACRAINPLRFRRQENHAGAAETWKTGYIHSGVIYTCQPEAPQFRYGRRSRWHEQRWWRRQRW